jgi:peroxiredoxin
VFPVGFLAFVVAGVVIIKPRSAHVFVGVKAPALKIVRGADGLILRDKLNSNRSAGQSIFSTSGLFAFTVFLLLTAPPTAWSARPKIAAAAPDFALKSVTGENLRLSEYRGDIVLLNFWSTRCGRCRAQLSELDTLYSEHREQGLQLLSVNIDEDKDSVREAVANLQLQFPVMFDEHKSVSQLYDLGAMPFTVLIDHTGTVRYVHAGYKRGDEFMYGDEMEILLAE